MMFLMWGIAFVVIMFLALSFSYRVFSVVRDILNPVIGAIEGLVLGLFYPFVNAYKTGGIAKLIETIVIVLVVLAFIIFIICKVV